MRLSLSARLIGPWFLFILLISGGLFTFQRYATHIDHDITLHNQRHQQAVEITKELLLLTQDRWTVVLEHFARPSPLTAQKIMNGDAHINTLFKQLEQSLNDKDLESLNKEGYEDSAMDDSVLANFALARTGLTDAYLALVAAIDAHDTVMQQKAIELVARKMRMVHASLDDLMQYHIIARQIALDYSKRVIEDASTMLYQFIALLLLIIVAFTIYQTLDIVRPLRNLTNAISRYDVDADVFPQLNELDRNDEIGNLARNFHALSAKVQEYVKALSERQTEILQQMADIAHVGGWEVDLIKNSLSWTNEVYRIHELNPDTPLGLADTIEYYAPEGRPVIQAAIDAAIKDGSPWDLELPIITSLGRHRWVRSLGNATLQDGKVIRLNGAFQDVTEKKKISDAILQANADLEGFSYSVSHDLRTPLRAIDGFSNILLEDYADKLDEEGQRLLNVVRSNTVRMATLIDDILHFSRAGRVELKTQEVDMDAMAHKVLDELNSMGTENNVTVTIDLLSRVHGDPALLHQVWENLIANAIKFCGKNVEPKVEIGMQTDGGETIFHVRDNGVGFDMKYADKLFGVFQRLHGINEFPGTGIGLAIAKRIINRHGGRIWAEAELGKGATFYFSIPDKEPHHD
ncbi:MAG: ATP-binding protein [Gallionella sp.]|nr:ATP-binding protein [Gallionella sp.]